MTEFYEKLIDISGSDHVKTREEMKRHTTFHVGGPAAFYVSPDSEGELADIIRLCGQEYMSYFILGNGSNLLVSDGGYDGVIISMTEGFSYCNVQKEQEIVIAGAGTLLSRTAKAAYDESLTGFEFAAGIPGTVGGAVAMNAGAYGSEMKEILECVRVLTPDGEWKNLTLEELELGYRTSSIIKNRYIVIEAKFRLMTGNQLSIREKMNELAFLRKSKQPLDYPSAGSTFKRPEGYFAGKLIQDAGLCGYRVGGAEISQKHCGFVINRDRATAADIRQLCEDVKEKVKEHSGVSLDMEVKMLGRF